WSHGDVVRTRDTFLQLSCRYRSRLSYALAARPICTSLFYPPCLWSIHPLRGSYHLPVHVPLALSMVYARLVYVRPSLSSVLVYLAVVTRCTCRASPYLSFTRQTPLYRTYRLSASPGLVLSLISSISIHHASVAFTQLNPLHCFAIYSNIVCEYRFRISVSIQVRTFRAWKGACTKVSTRHFGDNNHILRVPGSVKVLYM
ncbi:hypothetical protein K523DRAFT_409801, partial [Schizophyllum commune Tattone D]